MTITIGPPGPEILGAIDQWHRLMRGDAPDALADLLADDVVMFRDHQPVDEVRPRFGDHGSLRP